MFFRLLPADPPLRHGSLGRLAPRRAARPSHRRTPVLASRASSDAEEGRGASPCPSSTFLANRLHAAAAHLQPSVKQCYGGPAPFGMGPGIVKVG